MLSNIYNADFFLFPYSNTSLVRTVQVQITNFAKLLAEKKL